MAGILVGALWLMLISFLIMLVFLEAIRDRKVSKFLDKRKEDKARRKEIEEKENKNNPSDAFGKLVLLLEYVYPRYDFRIQGELWRSEASILTEANIKGWITSDTEDGYFTAQRVIYSSCRDDFKMVHELGDVALRRMLEELPKEDLLELPTIKEFIQDRKVKGQPIFSGIYSRQYIGYASNARTEVLIKKDRKGIDIDSSYTPFLENVINTYFGEFLAELTPENVNRYREEFFNMLDEISQQYAEFIEAEEKKKSLEKELYEAVEDVRIQETLQIDKYAFEKFKKAMKESYEKYEQEV